MRDRWLYPWGDPPADPFAIINMNAVSSTPLADFGKRRTDDHLCRCGCKLPHNHAVSRLITVHEDRHVLWYRNVDHLNSHTFRKQSHVLKSAS
jgi:hypothetical protein